MKRTYRACYRAAFADRGLLPSFWADGKLRLGVGRRPRWPRKGSASIVGDMTVAPAVTPTVSAASSASGVGFAAWAAITAACMIMLLSTGLRSTMGLFAEPTSTSLAISIGAFSFGIALHQLLWGLLQPFAGVIADKMGPIPALLLGAAAYGGGFAIMALAEGGGMFILGAGVAIGLGLACTSFGVMAGAVARLVPPKDRSTMFGIIAAAGAMGQATVVPATQQTLEAFDWRTVAWALAAVACAIALLAIAFRGQGGNAGTASNEPDIGVCAAIAEAMRHPGYLMLMAGFFVCGFQLMFIVNHLPNFLALCDLPPSAAGSAIALIGSCNAIGCYSFGRLGALYSRRRLLALIYIVRAVAIAFYMSTPITVTSTLIFAAVMGFFWLGTAPLTSGLVTHMLGARYLSSIYGPVFLSHQLGAFLGVWLGGVVFDLTGGYDNMWVAAGIIGMIAAAWHMLLPDRRVARLQFV